MAQRDTDAFDIGYHYAPIDYAITHVDVASSLLLTNGAVVAWFGYGCWTNEDGSFSCDGSRFRLQNGGMVVGQGAPDNLNRLTDHAMVQERPLPAYGLSLVFSEIPDPLPPGPAVQLRFTEYSPIWRSYLYYSVSRFALSDCWLRGAGLGGYLTGTNEVALTNNIFERVAVWQAPSLSNGGYYWNNLFFGEFQLFENLYGDPAWLAYDNAFDGATLLYVAPTNILNGNNGYINTSNVFPGGASNVVLSAFSYTNGWLGSYYQKSTNFVDKGNVRADLAGLYHYTTRATQEKETNSIVDIGFHYVAVDTNGKPFDTDGDGVPDYLEDVNGNGNGADDPTSWLIYNSANGLTGSAGIQVFTPLK